MSLYEKIIKTIDSILSIESDAAAIDTLVFELRPLLRGQGVFFPIHEVQAVRIDKSNNDIIIEIFLQSIEIWVKIYKDGYVNASIYPILNCSG
jgi:hypothetical protein